MKKLIKLLLLIICMSIIPFTVHADEYSLPPIDIEVKGSGTVVITPIDDSPVQEVTTLYVEDKAQLNFKFPDAGNYKYEVTLEDEKTRPTDKTTWVIDIFVGYDETDNHMYDVTVIYKKGSETKSDSIIFDNDGKIVMTDPPVKKTISGDTPEKASNFIFALQGLNNAPMPETAKDNVIYKTITGPGEAEFGAITYTSTGTYEYDIYEVDGGVSGYTYDKNRYHLTVEVTLVDNEFVLNKKITVNGKDYKDKAVLFNNPYSAPSPGKKIIDQFVIPTTGIEDGRVVYRFNYELLFAIILILLLIVYVLRRLYKHIHQ